MRLPKWINLPWFKATGTQEAQLRRMATICGRWTTRNWFNFLLQFQLRYGNDLSLSNHALSALRMEIMGMFSAVLVTRPETVMSVCSEWSIAKQGIQMFTLSWLHHVCWHHTIDRIVSILVYILNHVITLCLSVNVCWIITHKTILRFF